MKTDIIEEIDSLNTTNFSDYKFLAFQIREAILSYDMENFNKPNEDNNSKIHNLRINSMNYIKDKFNDKLKKFSQNFFFSEELIRNELKNNPSILDEINYAYDSYFFHLPTIIDIERIDYGPKPYHWTKVATERFKKNYRSGHYLRPKEKIKENEGCFIATFVYGSYDHEKVMELRNYRDITLINSKIGRDFIRTYYKYSPTLVKYFKNNDRIKSFLKIFIDFFVLLIRHSNKKINPNKELK